ncbi:hypothetical protein I578_00845 [Lactococcus garvieae ATCC 49156]|nr:hypothetical protein OO3_00460 [Lactococcus garvieae ATCC 49156]EOT93309.1 hypothetical protein I578_00845 [Lactococcus garvieae ATCC 49156]
MTYKPDDYLTTKDIAVEFSISAPTVYRRKKRNGYVPTVSIWHIYGREPNSF